MKKLLVVVDYQNDFIDGTLGFAGAEKLTPKIYDLINQFKKENQTVIYTKDTHSSDYMETIEGKNLPVLHCIKGTKGWELPEILESNIGNDLVIEKDQFGSVELGNYIKENNHFDEIYLCGLVSDICVFSNAVVAKSSANTKTKIIVVANATDSYNHDNQDMGFKMLEHLHIEIKQL